MNEQINFFEAFGLDGGDDFFGAATKKKDSKPAAKKEDKKTAAAENAGDKAKAGTAKPKNDFVVKLPVTIKARSFKIDAFSVGTAAEAKVSEVWDELAKTYPQFEINKFGLAYVEEINCIFVCDGGILLGNDNISVFDDENGTVKICDGGTACELTPADFPGVDPDEVTLKELRDRFVDSNPSYEGCKLILEGNVAYPMFDSYPSKCDEVVVGGEKIPAEWEDIKTNAELAKKIVGDLQGKVSLQIRAGSAHSKTGYIVFVSGKAPCYCPQKEASRAAGTEARKAVEKKYALPMKLIVCNFNQTYELTSSMFDGKEKVTKSEVTKAMSKVDSMFGDSDRKIEYLYNENSGVMSCMFVSGKKGALR